MSTWLKHVLILVFIALFFRGKGIYLVFYGLIVIYAVFGRLLVSTLRRVSMKRQLSTYRAFPGDIVQVRLSVENPTYFPLPWFQLQDSIPHGWMMTSPTQFACSLGAHSTESFQYEIQAQKRGLYRHGEVIASAYDPFGIHHAEETFTASQAEPEILVYPRVRPLSEFGLTSDFLLGGYGKARRAMPDPLNVVGTRDYITFESIRHVHWKASAHTGTLHVKQFAPTKHLDVSLLLDLAKDRYDSWNEEYMSELAIEVAASILFVIGRRQSAFDLTIVGRLQTEDHSEDDLIHIAQGHGESRLLYALEVLAQVQMTPKHDIDTVWSHLLSRKRQSTLVIITPDIEKLWGHLVHSSVVSAHRTHVIEISERIKRPAIPVGLGYTRISYAGEIGALATGARQA